MVLIGVGGVFDNLARSEQRHVFGLCDLDTSPPSQPLKPRKLALHSGVCGPPTRAMELLSHDHVPVVGNLVSVAPVVLRVHVLREHALVNSPFLAGLSGWGATHLHGNLVLADDLHAVNRVKHGSNGG